MLKKFGVADLHDGDRVVVENSRHVFRWEFISGIRDEQAGLANSTVTHYDTP